MAVQNLADRQSVRQYRREQLRAFLRSRRARVSPADVGMPHAGSRRTPGLRREEVAVLAGVGVSWYTWLEQGRDIRVSDRVLDAISDALLLAPDERAYLYVLAGLNPPAPPVAAPPISPRLRRLLDGWLPRPAYVLNDHWRCGGDNLAAHVVFQSDHQQSFIRAFFSRDRYQTSTWPRTAATLTARLRTHLARAPDDPVLQALVEEMQTIPEFTRLWDSSEVHDDGSGLETVLHPDAGELTFEPTTLQIPTQPGHQIVVLDPDPITLAKIVELMKATPDARQCTPLERDQEPTKPGTTGTRTHTATSPIAARIPT